MICASGATLMIGSVFFIYFLFLREFIGCVPPWRHHRDIASAVTVMIKRRWTFTNLNDKGSLGSGFALKQKNKISVFTNCFPVMVYSLIIEKFSVEIVETVNIGLNVSERNAALQYGCTELQQRLISAG